MIYDVLIIGGGILGASIARELSKYKLDVAVVEKGYDIGEGATKANSGVLGAGFHPRGGSLKGISCVKGNQMYRNICRELGVSVKYTGSLFVAFHQGGIEAIEEKYNKGLQNGVPGMRIIDGDEARLMEPGLSPKVIRALYAPTTGIISVFSLILKTAQSAAKNGVEFLFDTEVLRLESRGEIYVVETNRGEMKARFLVNAAGEEAAKVENFVRPADLVIKPRRGQFYVFDKQGENGLSHVIYQAQETDEKGCLLAPTVEGNILAGPTSENVRDYNRVETTREGLAHIERVAKKLLPDLDMGQVITSFAGVRANIRNVVKEEKDFVVRVSGPRMVSCLGIKNPGMTAAPYLSLLAVELLQKEGLGREMNPRFDPYLTPSEKIVDLPEEKQKELCAADKRYGNVVCRCEQVTEGDILRVLKEPLPPGSLNGMKKRLRLGMGRCQGGFCTPRLIEILSREWGKSPEEICKSGKGSNLVKGRLK